ncbi:MAG TPA: hypothetical protein VGI39_06980 [Polyangiaceae bacterium]|jgi:hypothetical protein
MQRHTDIVLAEAMADLGLEWDEHGIRHVVAGPLAPRPDSLENPLVPWLRAFPAKALLRWTWAAIVRGAKRTAIALRARLEEVFA